MNALKKGIEDTISIEGGDIRDLAALEAFIGGLANEVRITPPRPMRLTSPEDNLRDLLTVLVPGKRAAQASGQEVYDAFYRR